MAYTTINDPSVYFQTVLYTGSSSSVSPTFTGNANLQPDTMWIKSRSGATNHNIYDSSRGSTERLYPNLNSQVDTVSGMAFNSDGFTTGTNSVGDINVNGSTYVGWGWKVNGGTTSSNTDGTITSTVQANTTAGFSIVTYTGNNTGGATIGHGLGVAPKVVFTKTRVIADNWLVYHEGIGATKYLTLNTSSSVGTSSGAWNDTAPSSTVVTLGSFDNSNDNDSMVAYCFAEKQGYSKFGSYTGNGNVNGPMVFCGFSPSWLMIKRTNDIGDWNIIDTTRDTFNTGTNSYLYANTSGAEQTGSAGFDILSNGFKNRNTHSRANASGSNYIYMAFAQNPLVASNNVIALAR